MVTPYGSSDAALSYRLRDKHLEDGVLFGVPTIDVILALPSAIRSTASLPISKG
jgi:hypothetical protein